LGSAEIILMYRSISDGVGLTFNHRIWERKFSLPDAYPLFEVKNEQGKVIGVPTLRENPFRLTPQEFCMKANILAIGDSYTFGDGVAAEESYPAQLQKIVPGNVMVTNLGVRGMDTKQEALILQKYCKLATVSHHYSCPNLVVVIWQYCYNDVENIAKDSTSFTWVARENPVAAVIEPLKNISFVTNWAYWSLERQGLGAGYKDYLRKVYSDKRVIKATVAPIVAAKQQIKVPFLLLVFPILPDLDFSDSIYQNLYHELDTDSITYMKVGNIDQIRKMRYPERVVSLTNPHPSASVHQIVAEEIKRNFIHP
jgi:hypothetical protein